MATSSGHPAVSAAARRQSLLQDWNTQARRRCARGREAGMFVNGPELEKCAANFVPLSPISFLKRAADFFGERTAVVHGDLRFTYRDLYARTRRLAHAL